MVLYQCFAHESTKKSKILLGLLKVFLKDGSLNTAGHEFLDHGIYIGIWPSELLTGRQIMVKKLWFRPFELKMKRYYDYRIYLLCDGNGKCPKSLTFIPKLV